MGSTGSVGCSTLDVLSSMDDEWSVVGLAALGTRAAELAEQANRFRPEAIAVAQTDFAESVQSQLCFSPAFHSGDDALVELIESVPCDCVVSAVVGTGGLRATLRAVEMGRRIALANKEVLVIAGSLLMPLAAKTGAEVIPVDSEHSAIYQAMHAGRTCDVERIYLTASGGPFRTWSEEKIDGATLEDALNHPTWDMGPKISIDSASMMNKALEIVEARWLFDLTHDRIGVVIHPESIIHSLVEFCDGSMIAQLGTPDMRTPIQYALTYPQRRPCPSKRLDLAAVKQLNFSYPDVERFPAVRLGHEVAERGGTAGAVMNAANEAAVDLFRKGHLRYREIVEQTQNALSQHEFMESPTLEDLLASDRWAREEVARCTAC